MKFTIVDTAEVVSKRAPRRTVSHYQTPLFDGPYAAEPVSPRIAEMFVEKPKEWVFILMSKKLARIWNLDPERIFDVKMASVIVQVPVGSTLYNIATGAKRSVFKTLGSAQFAQSMEEYDIAEGGTNDSVAAAKIEIEKDSQEKEVGVGATTG